MIKGLYITKTTLPIIFGFVIAIFNEFFLNVNSFNFKSFFKQFILFTLGNYIIIYSYERIQTTTEVIEDFLSGPPKY